MLRPRIICSLLIDNGDLVKTKKFADPIYIGDPINTIKIFNEKRTDEICIFDISARINEKINFDILEKIANVSRMPISYGGGIFCIDQIEKILSMGLEKVILNSEILVNKNFKLLEDSIKKFGSQSIAVCIDVIEIDQMLYAYNKLNNYKIILKDYLNKINDYQYGELIINSVSDDGCMDGYNIKILEYINDKTKVPITIIGGAGKLDDLISVSKKFNISGYGCGSIFCFKQRRGTVLINYFDDKDKSLISF